jgi:hypothetical protein
LRGWGPGLEVNGQWWCAGCAERALARALEPSLPAAAREPVSAHRLPLGLILLGRGLVGRDELEAALAAQRSAGYGMIGEWLERLHGLGEREITNALGQQWGCPVYALATAPDSETMALIPLPLLEEFAMVPVRYDAPRKALWLAFAGAVAHAAMLAIESMLDCRVHPCMADGSWVRAVHDEMAQRAARNSYVFSTVSDAAEMTRVTLSFARRLAAQGLRTARLRSLVWIRLQQGQKRTDLLFRSAALSGARLPLKVERVGADKRQGYGNHYAKAANSHRG